MSNTMEYKGYVGSVEFSAEDAVFYGKVLGVRSLLSYEGESAKDLVEDFHCVVDEYLELCAEEGLTPEKTCSGDLQVTVPVMVHAKLVEMALKNKMPVDDWIARALEDAVATI